MSSQSSSASSGPRQKQSSMFPHFEFQRVIMWPFMLPFISIGGSIIISVLYHFDDVTATHCKVSNWLPTISAAVGNNAPEKYLFRFGIALKSLREHKKKQHGRLPHAQSTFEFWNLVALVVAIIEDLALCTLTMVSSTDDKNVHILAFVTFMLSAHLHFVASLLNNKYARSPFTDEERKYYRYRILFASLHTATISFAAYLYWRHNEFCEPGIYSIFALCEYLVVLFNICFHAVGFFEWGHLKYAIRDHNLVGKED